jgi:hypothetical protein
MKKRIDFVFFCEYPSFVSKIGLSPGDSKADARRIDEDLNRFAGNEVFSAERALLNLGNDGG